MTITIGVKWTLGSDRRRNPQQSATIYWLAFIWQPKYLLRYHIFKCISISDYIVIFGYLSGAQLVEYQFKHWNAVCTGVYRLRSLLQLHVDWIQLFSWTATSIICTTSSTLSDSNMPGPCSSYWDSILTNIFRLWSSGLWHRAAL
jgi:hypothetical protein